MLDLSGISFATLGYARQVVGGPLRLLVMMQALTGFMLITRLATYIDTIAGERFRIGD